ncbi:MAG: YHS domain-containing protein [Hyphomonadaceae bacterium]|nr:YHS domain-containing protein [Hyphomonadaceae bacterium]
MIRTLIAAFLLAALPLAAPTAFAEKPPVYTGVLSNLAVGGYDPVAYFRQGAPVRGNPQHRIVHQGFEYRFASAENLAAFRQNPNAYLPQYGGYCAWAVAHGYTASADPNAWRIVDGKLYLNYNAEIQGRWAQDIPNLIRQGDANWPSVLQR